MALDIVVGDEAVIGNQNYPIVAVEHWQIAQTPFAKMMTEMLTTKRAPQMENGKRGDAEQKLFALQCTPLLPVSPTIQFSPALQSPHTLFELFVAGDGEVVHLYVQDTDISN